MKTEDITQTLPLELRAHLYQKLEALKAYLVPGLEIDVQINPKAKEGFSIAYSLKGSGFELKTGACGENAFTVTTEATDRLIAQIQAAQVHILEHAELNSGRPMGIILH